MKNYLHDIALIIIGAFFGIAIFGSATSHNYEMTTEDPSEPEIQYVYVESEPEIVKEYVYLPSTQEFFRNFTEKEAWCLRDLGMREAENQGVIGQCWVMYTALCRAEAYGQSIEEVWESKAFESSMCNTGKTPNDDCNEALALIEEGWTPKPLWFRRDHYHNFGNPLCQVGDHCFSGK